MKNPIVSKS